MYRNPEQREFARRLRNAMKPAERELWRLLRAQQLRGFKFRRQAAIGAYVVDFVCFSHKLIVELDGPPHGEDAARRHDTIRTQWLAAQGYRTLRLWNHQMDEDWQLVVDEILKALLETDFAAPPPSPALPTEGRGPEEI
jgi:very-short-patch-repair endonuclease